MIDLEKYKDKKYGKILNKVTGKTIDIDNVISGFFKFAEYFSDLYKGGLYEEQKIIAAEMIVNLLKGNLGYEKDDVYINIARQFGKSFIVFLVVGYILYIFPVLVGKKGYTVGLVINKNKQIKKNFNSLRKYLQKSCSSFGLTMQEDNANGIEISNGSKVVVFSMEANNNSGETLDFIINDESQHLKSEKFDEEIGPMKHRTGSNVVYIGVGGKRRNSFYEGLNNGKNVVLKLDYQECIDIAEKRYNETGDIRHLIYKKSVEKELSDGKISPDVFKTEYKLEWILGVGNFITLEELQQYKGASVEQLNWNGVCYAGLDYGKAKDFSILTIVAVIDNKVKVLRWEKMQGNYKTQFERIRDVLKGFNVAKIWVDATGVGGGITDFLDSYIPRTQIEYITFTAPSKHEMYSNLQLVFQQGFQYLNNSHTKIFEKEFADLEKEYKGSNGNYMSCHHPAGANYHDDYCDSLALACMFKSQKKYYSGQA